LITGTHAGEWVGIAPSGNRINMRVVSIFEFDEDRLMCEKAYMDVATMLAQVGVLPRVG
jgi:predicted ester cyclase